MGSCEMEQDALQRRACIVEQDVKRVKKLRVKLDRLIQTG